MRFLMIYPNQVVKGHKPIGISMISAILKEAGHDMRLFDTTKYDLGTTINDVVREELLEYKKVQTIERDIPRVKISFEGLIDKLCREIESYKPELIGVSAISDFYPLGIKILNEVKTRFRDILTIMGGVHATVDPESVIEEGCVDMVCVGEGEGAMLELADRMDDNRDLTEIQNIWIKKSVSIGVETGNEQLRREVLNKPIKNETFKNAFRALNESEIRTCAFLMFGLPHQTMGDAKNDVKMVKEFGVDTASVVYFYPYKGTKLRELCVKENLVSEEKLNKGESSSHDVKDE